MTSTDSSNSQNQNNSTSETLVDTSNSKAMNTTTNNESQAAANESQHEVSNTADMSNMSSSEASSSPSSSSPASSSPATSSNNTSTDKEQAKATTEDNNKPSESEQPANPNNNTNKPSQKSNHSKKNHTNQKHNSIDHSPIVVPPSQLAHQPFVNYYPYVPRGSAPNSLPPYTQQFDASASQQGPWLSHAMAAMSSDPMAMAAYMNNGQQPQNGAPYPTDQQHYEQFNFGFTPAFGFGYAGTGSIDYMSIQQAAQQGSNLNPQSTQWTPNSATATGASTTTTTTTTTATASNPASSPANTTTSSNDTTSSVPSTSASETSASNVKWMQVTQDPSSVLEFNAFPQQQLSPVDMYTPQAPHHNNSNSYRSYNRHQMQPNYHHYQYQNPYQHYPGQYNMHPMHTNSHGNHHYNSHKYNKYNNYYNDNNTGFNYHTHDNNNNSKKSNNLNNTDATTTVNGKQAVAEASETTTGGTETKSESGSKSWASIVGVSGSTSNTSNSNSTQQTSTGSSPAPAETTQIQQQPQYQYQNKKYTQSYQQYNNFYGEYVAGNNMRPRNNYQKGYHNNKQQNNLEQQAFDLTNRSFPPINATVTKDELNEIKKSSVKKDPATYETSTGYNPAIAQQHQFSQNSKKQQQYNNYQRQQQQEFSLPFGKYHQNYHQNGATVNYVFNNGNPKYTNNNESSSQVTTAPHHRAEKPYKGESSYFNKRHQPSQRTLSSFLNVNDKTKLDDSKFSTNGTTKQTSTSSAPKSETSIEQLSQQADQLQIVDPNLQQQHQQLTVYMNPSAYNPIEFNTSPKAARFFVIKSYSEDDIHRSIKYNIWCSTEHGNRRLDSAYFKGDGQVPVYLFFSVNGSGHFCGMAEMESRVDYNRKTGVWTQEKWRGCFHVKWIYVKDVPNSLLRNIKLENNDNKPVTNSRDTQEIPYDKGIQVLKVFHTYNHSSSILDDFEHYERKQEEDKSMQPLVAVNPEVMVNKTNQVEETKPAAQESNDKETAEKKPEQAVDSSVPNSTTKTTTSNVSVTSSPSSSSSSSTASSTSSIDESKEPSQEAANKAPQQTTTAATEVVVSST